MINLNGNFEKLVKNYLFSEIAKRVSEYSSANPDKKIIRLGIGDVTLPLTASVIKALKASSEEMAHKETFRGYCPEPGYDFLRNQIAAHYKLFGVELNGNEIHVSDGAKSDLGNLTDILGKNDVLIPDPVYPVYNDSNIMSGNNVTFLPANTENGFLPMPDGIEKKSMIIYLCSPNNPTGAVYNKEQLKKWVNFALESESLIVFDSAYEAYINGDYPHSIYEIEGAEKCAVEICSLSKTAGFTGTRCGWSIYPDALNVGGVKLGDMWARRQATKFNGVPYVIQRAAMAALTEKGYAECKDLIGYYMENAKILSSLLEKKGIYFTGGESSPYIWLRCPGNMASWEFFDYLLNNVQIVGTPGSGFGKEGEGYFRLTAFGSRENTLEAVERLDKLL